MSQISLHLRIFSCAAAFLLFSSPQSRAQTDLSFKDKTISVVSGFSPGGPTDILARAFADAMERHLPGRPIAVVRNEPGAEGVVALNTFVAQTKPDGLTVAIGASGNFDPLLNKETHATYNPVTLKYVGGLSVTASALLIKASAVSRLTDRRAAPVIMGASNNLRTTMLAVVLGTAMLNWNVRWVFGYPGTGDLQFALSRGEIDMTTLSNPDFLEKSAESGKFVIYFQTAPQSNSPKSRPELANVPDFTDLVKGANLDATQREAVNYWSTLAQVGFWMTLHPNTPPSIVSTYRAAFHAAMSDPEFIKQTQFAFPDSEEVSGDDLTQAATMLANTSAGTLAYYGRLRDGLK